MRRLLLFLCVLVALACKLGDIAVENGVLGALLTAPSAIVGDVKAEPAYGHRNTLIPVTFTGKFPLETWVVRGAGITVDAVNQPSTTQIQAAVTIL